MGKQRCSPSVHLVCYHVEYDGRLFVLIAVAEFDEMPIICTKPFELPGSKPNKVLLRSGAIYLRTPNAESAPLSTPDEVRQLIGLATLKRTDQMLSMFQSMLKGQPLLKEEQPQQQFDAETEDVQTALSTELETKDGVGCWNICCHPLKYNKERWEQTRALRKLLASSVVQIRREFPPQGSPGFVHEWGIGNRQDEVAFGLTHSGLFVSKRLFLENYRTYRDHWTPGTDIKPGEWLDLSNNITILIEFFIFVSRYAQNFDVGEMLELEISALPIQGRRLTAGTQFPFFDRSEPCRANRFRYEKVETVEKLRSEWEPECVRAIRRFLELFPGPTFTDQFIIKQIHNFRGRTL